MNALLLRCSLVLTYECFIPLMFVTEQDIFLCSKDITVVYAKGLLWKLGRIGDLVHVAWVCLCIKSKNTLVNSAVWSLTNRCRMYVSLTIQSRYYLLEGKKNSIRLICCIAAYIYHTYDSIVLVFNLQLGLILTEQSDGSQLIHIRVLSTLTMSHFAPKARE